MMNRALAGLTILVLLSIASSVDAQLDFGTDFSLSMTPEHPAPGEKAHIEVRSLLLDLEGGAITWYVNGKASASGIGLSQTEVTAGPLGSVTHVRAVLTEEGFERATAEAILRPVEIDLLWESDSYTPPYFRGRALASAGTNLHVEAIPRFKRADGSFVAPRDIVFTWRKNGYVIQSVSGHGKSKAVLPSPPLFGTDTLSVEARTPDGVFAGVASARIASTEPVLSLYENHPLFGIMYHRALGAENFLPEVEISFVAIPYFAETDRPSSDDLLYEWRVDGNSVSNDPMRPNEITVNAEGSSGIALVELALSHATNLFLSASGAWRVTLGTSLGGAAGNPFGTSP